MADVITLVNIW